MAEQVKAALKKRVRSPLVPMFGDTEEARGQMVIIDLKMFLFFCFLQKSTYLKVL